MEIFGRPGALFYAWIVCLSCLGTLNAQMFSTGRLTQAAGARKYLPAFFNAAAGSTADGQRHNHKITTLGGFFSWISPFPNIAKDQNIPMYVHVLLINLYWLFSLKPGLITFSVMQWCLMRLLQPFTSSLVASVAY